MRYNPFHYIRSEKDILKLVNTIIANTKGDGEKSGEDFWIKAERLLYCALIGYIWYEAPEEEQNFSTLLEFINASEAREDDETFKNAVDELFEELEKKKPEHFAVRQYKKYKLAAGKTAKSILISCGARLAPFDIAELRDLMAYDEMELDLLGDRRTALFVIISDTDDTFNFVVSIMYTQLFNLLCDRADDQCGGQLKYHVRLLLDEFANIGLIPKSTSDLPPSAAARFRHPSSCSPRASLKPSTRMPQKPSSATAIPCCSSAARKVRPSKKFPKRWEKKQSTYITHPTHAVKAHPLVQPTKRPERSL